MKKFALGLLVGILFSLTSVAVASNTIEITPSPIKLIFNGKKANMGEEYAAFNYNGHLYVPIRYVSEAVGAAIGYNAKNETVSVLFSKDHAVIKDPNFPNIAVSNIEVAKNDNKKVSGQLLIDKNRESNDPLYCFFTLSFYDRSGLKLGQIEKGLVLEGGRDYGKINELGVIHEFEAIGDGDFTSYSRLELKVNYFDVVPIKGSTPPVPSITSHPTLPVTLSSYCWRGCADYLSPIKHIDSIGQKPVEVHPGAEAVIYFDYYPKPKIVQLSRYLVEDGKQIDAAKEHLVNNVFSFPSEKGVYVYSLFAQWKTSDKYVDGDASYVFIVKVN
ncbi:copper amine oxidase N-terminal domain-containing protein [Paenibacillus mesophilus]|uniref:stalk domain-containing protein n=1 Tax=Paenibacillus mesophilus TaxID=2582849 RepID=UPI00110D7D6A|nr:stalk domain-containing protein [Paenibacillus mesophilus]TMV45642.1 copper amine oxidase N-terminal domain-containing protein [Paenibacillus mesophilus]